ncbi:hypothetical protein A464_1955 [Salmonella bongori N268-08]|uniref:Uncharacterized protein n=1 Tax=Salmonella bongori N268-08 TaxID=1197719 RepID=S5N964_SALBN|nr:hypothetical protein A464_1955 [Salmonella bongori N268-08]
MKKFGSPTDSLATLFLTAVMFFTKVLFSVILSFTGATSLGCILKS